MLITVTFFEVIFPNLVLYCFAHRNSVPNISTRGSGCEICCLCSIWQPREESPHANKHITTLWFFTLLFFLNCTVARKGQFSCFKFQSLETRNFEFRNFEFTNSEFCVCKLEISSSQTRNFEFEISQSKIQTVHKG